MKTLDYTGRVRNILYMSNKNHFNHDQSSALYMKFIVKQPKCPNYSAHISNI